MAAPETADNNTARCITFTVPREWWISANSRMHWANRAARTRTLRGYARLETKRQNLARSDRPVRVVAHIGYPTRRKADPANASPTVKALIDGLTDAGVWPDDSSEYLIGPDFRRDPEPAGKGTYQVRLEIITIDKEKGRR